MIVVAAVPLNFTVLVPWVEPKFAPVIVTDAPTAPEVGDRLVMLGVATTVKLTPLLFTPLAFTTTLPVVAPVGTVATIDVALQLVIVVAVVVLNFTVLVPWVEPKFAPVIVTDAPIAPVGGERLVMLGAVTTVNDTLLLFTPLAFTTTFPVVAPVGTVTTIDVALQLVIVVAAVVLNFTVLVPWVEPKFVPVIVTDAPTAPVVGERLVMLGAATTVKDTPLLALLPTVTTTFPVVAPVGTVATMDVALQLPIVVAVVPLNFTVLVPWVEPKFNPVIVTDAPTAPEVGDRLLMLGNTVNATPLLFTPLAKTTTLPVVAPLGTVTLIEVALQLVTVAAVPLNFTVLVPWVEPKFVPVTVTAAPTAPEVGDKLVMFGAATTVNDTPLLFTPLAFTTTLPVVAPVGTVATIDVALQLVIVVAVVVLNFTVLVPWVEPKFVPVIVTDAPTAPVVGDKLVMLGAATTVNAHPVAGVASYRHHHVPGGCSCRHRGHDRRCTPTPNRRRRRPVKLHCAGALRRTKIRPRDRHRCSDRPRSRRQTANAWEHGERNAVAGVASHRHHHVPGGCSGRHRGHN